MGPLPIALVVFFVLLVVGWIVLDRSASGRVIYVIGDNAEVARYSGVNVARTRLLLFMSSASSRAWPACCSQHASARCAATWRRATSSRSSPSSSWAG